MSWSKKVTVGLPPEFGGATTPATDDSATVGDSVAGVVNRVRAIGDTVGARDVVTGPVPSMLLGHWDHSRAQPSPDNLTSNTAVDSAMSTQAGLPRPVSNIMRCYLQSHPTSWDAPLNSCSQFNNRILTNINGFNLTTLLAGGLDSQITSWFNSIPSNVTIYITPYHEPENDGRDAAQWRASVRYYINLVAPLFRARGMKGGVGGLLMGVTFAKAELPDWAWWRSGINAENLPQVVGMVDAYNKFLTPTEPESIAAMVTPMFNEMRGYGITRFAIGETAISLEKRNSGGLIIGDAAGQELWVTREVPLLRLIPGLEVALYFHTETGPASSNAKLADGGPLIRWAQASNGQF